MRGSPGANDGPEVILAAGVAQEKPASDDILRRCRMADRQTAPPQFRHEIDLDRLPGGCPRPGRQYWRPPRVMRCCAGKAGAITALANAPLSRHAAISSTVRPRSSESIFL